ncbi:MAG: hypothetical protein ACK5FE_14930 [Cyanobacteriota bacterium]
MRVYQFHHIRRDRANQLWLIVPGGGEGVNLSPLSNIPTDRSPQARAAGSIRRH